MQLSQSLAFGDFALPEPWQLAAMLAFQESLAAPGLFPGPVAVLDLGGGAGWPPAPAAHWSDSATQEHRDQFAAAAAAWDWSEAAQAARAAAAARAEAKDALADPADPTRIAARVALGVIYESIAETRARVNELVAWANAAGAALTPLQVRTWAQAVAAVRQRIDAESTPPA